MDGSGKNLDDSGDRSQRSSSPPGRRDALTLTFASGPSAALGAEAVPSHYVSRTWSLRSEAARVCNHLVVVGIGTVTLSRDDGDQVLAGPAIAWLPAGCADQLEIAAGATAHMLRLKEGAWHRYVSPSAEEAYLDLARLREPLTLHVDADLAATVSRSIAVAVGELASPTRAGAVSIISAELTLCLLRLWRMMARDDTQGEGNSAETLSRFRRLVEQHYHHQLRVADFASLLSVSSDRLHAICTRTLQRSPSALIQQRVVQEAVQRLETGGTTIKQIAFALGFKDTAYFSRFFAKHTGVSPRAWRRSSAMRGEAGKPAAPALNFADWP